MIALFFLVLFAFIASNNAQTVTYSFCSTAYSNVSNSPALPWSVQTVGTLELFPSTGGLYSVTNATGYRIINTRGQTINQTIIGVAAVNSYHLNDNLLSITAPYLAQGHSFALRFNGNVEQVYFTGSERVTQYVNRSNQLVEADFPWNDGVVNSITSTFTLTAGSSSSCPALPLFPISAQALAAFNNRQQIPFCYSFSGGPGDGTPDQTLWTVSASGTFTISGLAGNASNGGQSFIVLGVTGTRSYVDMYYNVVNRIVSISPSSAVFSTRYPNFDSNGLTLNFDSSLFYWNGNASARMSTIVVDSALMFNELIGETKSIVNFVGNLDVQTPGDTQPLQCGFEDGSLASYQFCYRMSGNTWDVLAYGQFTATGPVIRRDYLALTMQGMTGVRVVRNTTGSYTQNIIKLVYVNGVNASSGTTILNDNLVFVDAPLPLDYYGFVYTLSSPAIFPDVVSPNGDINLSAGSSKWYEWPVNAGDLEGVEPQHAGGYFRWNATNAIGVGENLFPCDSSVSIPPMKHFYFCYEIATSEYKIQASGMILAYGANVTFQGRLGYAIANITGYRSFTRNGVTSYAVIESSNSESWGAINNTYSKILYPIAPYLDELGVVIHVDASAQTPLGTLVGEHIFDLSMGPNGNLTELGYTTGGNYQGLGWMTITEDERNVTCRVVPVNNNSANHIASSVLSIVLVLIVALAL